MRRAKSAEVSPFRPFVAGAALLAALQAGPVTALEFTLFDEPLKVENLFALGASWRTQNIDQSLIGKSTLYAINHPNGTGLCLTRVAPASREQYPLPQDTAAPRQTSNAYGAGDATVGTRACTASSPTGNPTTTPSPDNINYVKKPGSFSPNGDNGDLNFQKGDIVHAVAKLTTDVNYSFHDYNVFVRGATFFDANYSDFQETHYDTTMQGTHSQLNEGARRLVGVDYDILDYNVGHTFSIAEHDVAVKVGAQVLNWGESSLLALNSLNTINPPDSRRLNIPGLDLKEAFRPLGMVTMGTQIFEGYSIEGFYTYDWKPAVIDPPGTFFSQSDTLGDGGDYAMLSFAKAPEDPGYVIQNPTALEQGRYQTGKRGYYRPIDTCSGAATCTDSLGLLGSTASRTIFRDHAEEKAREPNGGDYGAVLKMFFDSINNGTEVSLYAAQYDSRLPVASAFAAHRSCITTAADMAPGGACGYNGPGAAATGNQDPIPVDTARLLIEYPKDIHLYGLSFNTTVGDYAVSGEYAFRENLPIQVDTVDVTYTALQPAFPATDQNLGVVTIPGRQSAFPSFLTRYRGYVCDSDATCIQDGQYVPGYERFKVGQANLTILRLIGGDNPIGASQMTMLFETGMQKVFDMPSLMDLQLEGTGSDTHISSGADGSVGIDPPGVTGNSSGNRRRNNGLMQNPTSNKDYEAYGTSESYGFRFLNLNRWDDAIFGVNLETLTIVRWDVKGTSPGIGTNFSDGRKQYNFGVRGDYLSRYSGEIRYTWFTGGHAHDSLRDRDNIQVYFGYNF